VAAAQEAPPAVESQDCARVEALMNLSAQTGSKPDQLVRGGGTIRDSTPVQASISADDAGDRWAWGAVNTQANGLSQITLDSDVPLSVRAFKGLSPINLLQDNAQVSEANLAPGVNTVSALLAGDGYYTLLVRRQNLADTSQTGGYTLTIGANVAGGVAFAPVDWRGQQALAAQRELIPPDGDGIVAFSPEPTGALTLRVPADALRSIQVERSIVVELATRGRLSWVREDVRELALLDGAVSVYLAALSISRITAEPAMTRSPTSSIISPWLTMGAACAASIGTRSKICGCWMAASVLNCAKPASASSARAEH
jgi:hypothetical protein